MPRTAPPARAAGPSRGPRNGLGAVTFVVVVLAALLAVFPATAGLGFLLCLLALVPAFVAHRRTRKGTATNRRRSAAAVLMAPLFLVVAVAVGAATTPPPRMETASDATALTEAAPAAVAPLVAAPTSAPVVAVAAAPIVDAPSKATKATSRTAVAKVAPTTKTAPTRAARGAEPTSARAAAAAPARADAVVRAAAPAPAAKSTTKTSKPAPASNVGSSVACDDDTHYVNAKGNCVLRPVKAASAPEGATAKCNDGTYSSSQSRSGTCSRHGGVAEWL